MFQPFFKPKNIRAHTDLLLLNIEKKKTDLFNSV